MDKSMGKLAFKDILEPMRMIGTHKDKLKTCLSLTSFNLMVVGDLQEKRIFITIPSDDGQRGERSIVLC